MQLKNPIHMTQEELLETARKLDAIVKEYDSHTAAMQRCLGYPGNKTVLGECCATCYWMHEGSTYETCRRNAPSHNGWPVVERKYHCGEYKPFNKLDGHLQQQKNRSGYKHTIAAKKKGRYDKAVAAREALLREGQALIPARLETWRDFLGQYHESRGLFAFLSKESKTDEVR